MRESVQLNKLSELLVEAFNKHDIRSFYDLLWEYSRPRGGPAPRAFLFTINGLTYPIHKEYWFAGVPYPSEVKRESNGSLTFSLQRSKRCYSMLAYLMSVRKGDLLFFFQADPQYPENLENRRGFRGIWVITSEPFMDAEPVTGSTGYEILGACPYCGVPFDFGGGDAFTRSGARKCLWCGSPFGFARLSNRKKGVYSKVVISLRLFMSPVIVFRRTSGDNRVYSDMGTPPLVWVSRTDNAMGPGKGSSIRVLLPEEMAKIGYMLASEDNQSIESLTPKIYPGKADKIVDYNGQPIEHLRSIDRQTLLHELMLNLYLAVNIDRPGHPLTQLLGIRLDEVEYWTSEFPWGYTGDTADFVLTLWNDSHGRYTIYIFELKKDVINVHALAELLLYIPWVSQVLLQFRKETNEVTIRPVLIGLESSLRRVPESYSIKIGTITGIKTLEVESPILLTYSLSNVYSVRDRLTGNDIYYARDLKFDLVKLPSIPIKPPPPTYTTTTVEKKHVARKYLASL